MVKLGKLGKSSKESRFENIGWSGLNRKTKRPKGKRVSEEIRRYGDMRERYG